MNKKSAPLSKNNFGGSQFSSDIDGIEISKKSNVQIEIGANGIGIDRSKKTKNDNKKTNENFKKLSSLKYLKKRSEDALKTNSQTQLEMHEADMAEAPDSGLSNQPSRWRFWPLEGRLAVYYQYWMLVHCTSILAFWVARIAFEEKPWYYVVIYEYYLDGVFFLDMLRIFNTPIFTESGKLILDRKIIARKYLRGWFIADLWAFYPLAGLRY